MQTYVFAFRLRGSSELCRLPVRTEAMAMAYARAALLEAVVARQLVHAYVSVGRDDQDGAVRWIGAWDWFERLTEGPLWTPYAVAKDSPVAFPGSVSCATSGKPAPSPHRH